MTTRHTNRLTEPELHGLFDRLFPHGFAGADVVVEIAPEGWERSSLLACFHPSVEQVFEERMMLHRNLAGWRQLSRERHDRTFEEPAEPTLDDVRSEYKPSPVDVTEEVTELVGMCLWDVFSDNHDVVAADGRVADIGSFRGASRFLDTHLSRDQEDCRGEDYLRFYLGTIGISQRTDLTPVYAMIFQRLKTVGAEWVYDFPELGLVELNSAAADPDELDEQYSVSEAAVAELNAEKRRAGLERFQAELGKMNAPAREKAMDRPPPATVRAYRLVFGRDPIGWPPA
jgi:hypothetical protein